MATEQQNVKDECKSLLKRLGAFKSELEIAEICIEKSSALTRYKPATLKIYISQLKNDGFRNNASDKDNFPYDDLKKTLSILLGELKKKNTDYDSTISFHYWSEGKHDNIDLDVLKTAFISFNISDLNLERSENMLLINGTKNKPCKLISESEEYEGVFKQIGIEKILSFSFENGTALLMHIQNNVDFVGKYYKGTYIDSPDGHIACGVALFEIHIEKTHFIKEKVTTLDEIMVRLQSELYKKRFLILSQTGCFNKVNDLKTDYSYNELDKIKGYYIRYRKSSTTQNIHGDLILIEAFGKVSYNGDEKAARHGRCFIQKDISAPGAKNLIIELYQEDDKDKQAFEFRYPHSFMMFDIHDTKPIIKGYLLKPNNNYLPHTANCFLLKISDETVNESNFNPDEFKFMQTSEEKLYYKTIVYHKLPGYKREIEEGFLELIGKNKN